MLKNGFRVGEVAEKYVRKLLAEEGFDVYDFPWFYRYGNSKFIKWYKKELKGSKKGLDFYAKKNGKRYLIEVKSSTKEPISRLKKHGIFSLKQKEALSKAREYGLIPMIVYVAFDFCVRELEIEEVKT